MILNPVTPQELLEDLYYCESHPVFFIFNRCSTYDGEAKCKRLFASGYPIIYQAKLARLIEEIIAVVKQGRDVFEHPDFHLLKSRQTGATWTISAILSYCFLFIPNFSAMLTSQQDNKLDSANYTDTDSFMGKVNYIVDNLPKHLRPNDSLILRSKNNYFFTIQNTSIKADCGVSPARGQAISMHAGDEFAEQEFTDMKLASLNEAIKGPNVLFSTPNGRQGEFYNIWLNGHDAPDKTSFNFWQVHWKEKMSSSKWEAFYSAALKKYGGLTGTLRRNLELSWDSLDTNNKVFSSFVESRDVVTVEPGKALGITCSGWDFGFGAPTVNLLVTMENTSFILLDCIYASGMSPTEFAIKAKQMYAKWNLSSDFIRHIGDISGKSKPREGTGQSSFELFHAEGISINGGTQRILEGIQVINGEFYKANLKINSHCQVVIDALNMAKFPTTQAGEVAKEEYSAPHPYRDILDALRYVIMYMTGRVTLFNEPDTVPGGWT
jgi:hypothetical protein